MPSVPMDSAAFTLSPTVEYVGGARYEVSGVVDGRMNATEARRNYDCFLRYQSSSGYLVDSTSVWQSH